MISNSTESEGNKAIRYRCMRQIRQGRTDFQLGEIGIVVNKGKLVYMISEILYTQRVKKAEFNNYFVPI